MDMEWCLLSIIIIYTMLMTASYSDATCNLDQQFSCRRAVREERLDVLPGGGECFEKEYVQFAYLCVVNNYLPSVDYCCCHLYSAVFCCRYHQDWNQFRCLHEEDEVTSRSLNETDWHQRGTDPLARFMQLSLPSALLLLILLLLGLGIVGCCLVATGVSCCSRRFRNRIFRIKDKKRNCVPKKKKGMTKFKESLLLQRTTTPIRDLDSLSGLMHGLTGGLSSPDHPTPAPPVTYEDDPVIDGGDTLHGRSDGHRGVLQPTAPSLAEIMGQECGTGCTQLPGHPYLYSTPSAAVESACWWSSIQRPVDDCRRQGSAASSGAGSTGDRRDDNAFSGSPNRYQFCAEPYLSHLEVEELQRPQETLSVVVSANTRH